MPKKKWGINFDGFSDYAKRLDKLAGDLNAVCEECLAIVPEMVNPGLETAISKHTRTGKTAASLKKGQKVEWQGNIASIEVGFEVKAGGLPALFLMYGTKPHTPRNQYGSGRGSNPGIKADKELYNALHGTKIRKAVSEKQKEIFVNAIKKHMEGT